MSRNLSQEFLNAVWDAQEGKCCDPSCASERGEECNCGMHSADMQATQMRNALEKIGWRFVSPPPWASELPMIIAPDGGKWVLDLVPKKEGETFHSGRKAWRKV